MMFIQAHTRTMPCKWPDFGDRAGNVYNDRRRKLPMLFGIPRFKLAPQRSERLATVAQLVLGLARELRRSLARFCGHED